MKPFKPFSFLIFLFILSILACSLPGQGIDDPFSNVIPDLTGTAFYEALLTPPPTEQPASTATIPAEPSWTPSPSALPPTVTLTPMPTLPDIEARNGPLIQALFFSLPPVIDGNLDDWTVPSYSANFVVYGSDQWSSSADLSATVQLGWDDQNLYIAAKITDDVFVQNASGENIFKGDSLELLLDTNFLADQFVSSLSPDDFQLGITAGSPSPGQAGEAYLWFPASISGKRSQVRIGAVQTASGYQVEGSVPWSLYEITPQPSLHLGFAFSVSDNDSPGQAVQQSMVSTVPRRRLSDPMTWGDLVLSK